MNGIVIYIEKLLEEIYQVGKYRVVIYDLDKHQYNRIEDVFRVHNAFRVAKNWQAATGYLIRWKSGQYLSKPTAIEIETYGIIV